jgi:hypothetical protein
MLRYVLAELSPDEAPIASHMAQARNIFESTSAGSMTMLCHTRGSRSATLGGTILWCAPPVFEFACSSSRMFLRSRSGSRKARIQSQAQYRDGGTAPPSSPKLRIDFPPGANVGTRFGADSGDVADVDLDCPEAVELADAYLPPITARANFRGVPFLIVGFLAGIDMFQLCVLLPALQASTFCRYM